MTPWGYAQRYLSVSVPTPAGDVPVQIRRYLETTGEPPTDAKDNLWSGTKEYLDALRRQSAGARLTLQVNGEQVSLGDREEFRDSLLMPFYGKGSPESCLIVLQLAMIVLKVKPTELQDWADKHLGLDCNGFVGNYLWHQVMFNHPWRAKPGEGPPGPKAQINEIFKWVAGPHEDNAIDDESQITLNERHVIARVDGTGQVIKGGPNSAAGHIAITQAGEVKRGPTQVRTVESGGFPTGNNDGVGRNWMTILRKHATLPKVFWVSRDRLAMEDPVKITPLYIRMSPR